jgi:hypothetical protein
MNPFVAGWILLCALVVASGWGLSTLRLLNAVGYGAALAGIGVIVVAVLGGRLRGMRWGGGHWRALWRRRFRRPLPLVFLMLALLAVAGGLLHAPNNYDALSYRVPRMLSWAAGEQWDWLHTLNPRQNNRAPGYEWLSMPLLVFTGTDRGFFLINAVSFALLPGLVFSVFTRLGVRPRVAESWMWLLPSGYGLVLQAGGMSNDMVAAPFALAAVGFALRAQRSRRAGDAWLSMLAAGLMTGVKGSNLPLLLPWCVALAPSWRLLLRTPLGSGGALVLAALVSFLPTAVLNHRHCGDWSGAIIEAAPETLPTRAVAFTANALQLVVQNSAPPVFPLSGWWNRHALEFLPAGLRAAIVDSNFRGGVLNLGELPIEDTASLGLGLTALLAGSWLWVLLRRRRVADGGWRSGALVFPRGFTRLLVWLPWVSLAVYMVKVVVTCAGRLIVPYYLLLTVALLGLPGHEWLVFRRAWQRVALAVLWLAVAVVIINPARPLWPANRTLSALQAQWPDNRLVERAARVYATYSQRHDALGPIREVLPASSRRVGLAASLDYPEASLWRPFGSRVVMHVLPGDTVEQLRTAGLEYVIVPPEFEARFGMSLEAWLLQMDAAVVGEATFAHLASQPPQTWRLMRLGGRRTGPDR